MLDPGVLSILEAVGTYGPDVRAYRALGNIGVVAQGDLLIFNYTKRATYAGTWNDVELASRGLIVHWPTATIAALAFPKFFNLNERPETQLLALPDGPCEITEKMDGSLGILYRTPDGPAIATRGSFGSPQAQWATRHLHEQHDLSGLPDDITLLFEIIYPGNTDGPVLRYGATEALYLIGARRFDGYDYGYAELAKLAEEFGFPLVARFQAQSIAELVPLAETYSGIEGWVVRFANGLRVKVKTLEYLALHRLAVSVTPGHVRDLLLQGSQDFEAFVVNLPDEFQREAQTIAAALLARVEADAQRIEAIFHGPLAAYAEAVRLHGNVARKDFALAVKANYAGDATYLFSLLDERDIRRLLLRAMPLAEPERDEVE
jgi:RNA ligase